MDPAAQPTVTTDEIFFDLDRFELEYGERLILRGRWFGVRGRRFVRPTLTLSVDGERLRALADLEHKPWEAEDGASWEASFPWSRGGEVTDTELSVAPDITLELPPPGGRSRRARRIVAQPRREAMSASWREVSFGFDDADADRESAPDEEPDPEVASLATLPEPEPPPLDSPPGEVAELRDELASVREELTSGSAKLASAHAELESQAGALSACRAELEETQEALAAARADVEARDRRLEAAKADLTVATADRDTAIAAAAEATAERDAAGAQVESLTREVQQARGVQEQARDELERSVRERDDAIAAHGAAVVMRRATRAGTRHRHAGWLARGLALLVLAGALLAALIVLHAL